MYDMKALYQAKSVADAVALRVAHPEAQIIAGGSDVLVQMREGKRAGKELISIYGLDELRELLVACAGGREVRGLAGDGRAFGGVRARCCRRFGCFGSRGRCYPCRPAPGRFARSGEVPLLRPGGDLQP